MSRSQYNTQGAKGDTPHSYSRIIKSIFKMEEKMPSVRDAVNAELIGHVRVCDTDVFLDRILPLPNGLTPQSMFDVLKNKRNYTQSKRWSTFPRKGSEPQAAESFFYGPFILAANAILGVVSDEKKNRLGGRWLDRHDEAPQSSEDSAKARPDCLFVARPPFVMKLEKEVRELEGKMKLRDSTLKERTARLEQQQSVWWRQIHIPVEIKKNNDATLFKQGMVQACTYLRLVLREQLDRRFAIALLLCGDELTVLLNDRSGLVYTKTPINIHESPLDFIQVIAAISTLAPWQIGWDPQMMVYDPKSRQSKASYEIGQDAGFFNLNLAKTHWEIDIPRPMKEGGGREKVLTLRALSISRSEVMCGRATLVWEVIRKEELDIDDSEKKIFVLKRYWHPYQPTSIQGLSSFMSEADRYRQVPLWGDRIYSYEDISAPQAQNQSKDSTLEHIRSRLDFKPPSMDTRQEGHKRFRDDPDLDLVCVTDSGNKTTFLDSYDGDLVSRVHTQITHTYTGHLLLHFKNLRELLQVILDVVKEHKHLYYEGRILHRDISSENIIIMPQNGNTVGRLIDLDHAKVVQSLKTIEACTGNFPGVEVLKRACHLFMPSINDEVIEKFIKYFAVKDPLSAVKYISDVVNFRKTNFDLDENHGVGLDNIGWDYQVNDPPDFSKHTPREGRQTGTLPFMSVEILKQGPVFELPDGVTMKDWYHDAIHDIESLFWVITYICLVREGPGKNMLRKELLSGDSENKDLQSVIYRYFDASEDREILLNKQPLFIDHEKMDHDILLKFHPYFKPLKVMMIQWWRIVILAYKHRKFEYYTIHDQIIHIIDKAMKGLSENQDSRTAVEEKRRLDEREQYLASVQGKPSVSTSGEQESPDQHIVLVEPIGLPQEPGSPVVGRGKRQRRGP